MRGMEDTPIHDVGSLDEARRCQGENGGMEGEEKIPFVARRQSRSIGRPLGGVMYCST